LKTKSIFISCPVGMATALQDCPLSNQIEG
jgi:hypothetical protein